MNIVNNVEHRTLEQRIKFDAGLTVGEHLVRFVCAGHVRDAVVRIAPRGKVIYLAKPKEGQMYASWQHVRGDNTHAVGGVYVWPIRDPEVMAKFEGTPVAIIEIEPQRRNAHVRNYRI